MMISFKFRRQSGFCATVQRLSNHEELHRRWVLVTAILDPLIFCRHHENQHCLASFHARQILSDDPSLRRARELYMVNGTYGFPSSSASSLSFLFCLLNSHLMKRAQPTVTTLHAIISIMAIK